MVDFISGRHSSNSILDVFASGLLGKAFSELAVAGYFKVMMEKRTGDTTKPSIIRSKTAGTKQGISVVL